MNFGEKVKAHMSDYRLNCLGITEKGLWQGREYEHILPRCLWHLNILEGFRDEFMRWPEKSKIHRHKGFHHLNSSQAACINLFFPPFLLKRNPVILALLGLGRGSLETFEFEKVIDEQEGTNFDCYLRVSGEAVYVEFKYSENGFGKAKDDKRHRDKLQKIYRPKLRGKVADKYLNGSEFFTNYQLLRNLVYFDPGRGDQVVFMYPRCNDALSGLPQKLDDMIPDKKIRDAVKIRHLGNALDDAVAILGQNENMLRLHFNRYKKKYLL